MRSFFHSLAANASIPALAIVLLGSAGAPATAQPTAATPAPSQDAPALPQEALTQKQIEGLLAAQSEMNEATSKGDQDADKPDPKIEAKLDGIAKKHGFADYNDYDKVASNVGLVLSGFDPDTKKFVGPDNVLKKQIAQVKADTQIPPLDKKKALDDLQTAIKQVTPIQYPGNIKLVATYYDKLTQALQGD